MSTRYQIRLDRETCEGIFACLVRDDRFTEDEHGLATIDAGTVRHDGEHLIATVEDDEIETAKQAEAACPVDAITVTPATDVGRSSTAQTTEASDD